MEHLTKIFSGNKKKQEEELSSEAYYHCQDHIRNRQLCWNKTLDEKNKSDCFDEELAEKKCLASRVCPELYKKFYEYTECHLWAAAFRKAEDNKYIEARDRINKDPAMSNMCRNMGYELSNEISKYSRYREEALEGESYLNKEGLLR
jgi:hypothetical protein